MLNLVRWLVMHCDKNCKQRAGNFLQGSNWQHPSIFSNWCITFPTNYRSSTPFILGTLLYTNSSMWKTHQFVSICRETIGSPYLFVCLSQGNSQSPQQHHLCSSSSSSSISLFKFSRWPAEQKTHETTWARSSVCSGSRKLHCHICINVHVCTCIIP